MRLAWDKYFLLLARCLGWLRSTCQRRKIGAVIVKDNRIIATGYVGQFSGLDHCTDVGCRKAYHGEATRFCLAVHAEENALMQAARFGISVEGATLYCTISPCYNCLKLAVSAGIKRIVFEECYSKQSSRQSAEVDSYWEYFARKCGVEIVQIELTDKDLEFAKEAFEKDVNRNFFRKWN